MTDTDADRSLSGTATLLMIACSEERAKVQRAARKVEQGQSLAPDEAALLLTGLARVYARLEWHTAMSAPGLRVPPWWRKWWPW